jgi:hypothetical protein
LDLLNRIWQPQRNMSNAHSKSKSLKRRLSVTCSV